MDDARGRQRLVQWYVPVARKGWNSHSVLEFEVKTKKIV